MPHTHTHDGFMKEEEEMPDYRFKVIVEIDVTDAESEAQARKTVFGLLTATTGASKGRPSSGPKASVTGLTIPDSPHVASASQSKTIYRSEILTGNPDVME